jgi:hypothetical protein
MQGAGGNPSHAIFRTDPEAFGPDRVGIKDWHSPANRAVLSSDLGALSAPRSCPAGLIADAGLRRCGTDAVINRMEDLNVKVCQEARQITIVC